MQESSSSQQFLSRKQVAALLHVSAASVGRYARAHRLPYVQTLGGHRRYPADAVIHLAEDLDRQGADVSPHELPEAFLKSPGGKHLYWMPPTPGPSRWWEGDGQGRMAGEHQVRGDEEEQEEIAPW